MAKNDAEKQGEAGGKDPAANTGTSSGGGAQPTPNEEQRIAADRERALRDQASTAVAEANAAKGRVAALEGELAKKDEQIAALQKANEALESRVAGLAVAVNRSGLPVLQAKLPESARQLRESVTIAAGIGAAKVRTSAKAGDVVMVSPTDKQLDKLQRELGVALAVHAIGPEQARELEESGFLA